MAGGDGHDREHEQLGEASGGAQSQQPRARKRGWTLPYPKVRAGVFAPIAIDLDGDER